MECFQTIESIDQLDRRPTRPSTNLAVDQFGCRRIRPSTNYSTRQGFLRSSQQIVLVHNDSRADVPQHRIGDVLVGQSDVCDPRDAFFRVPTAENSLPSQWSTLAVALLQTVYRTEQNTQHCGHQNLHFQIRSINSVLQLELFTFGLFTFKLRVETKNQNNFQVETFRTSRLLVWPINRWYSTLIDFYQIFINYYRMCLISHHYTSMIEVQSFACHVTPNE